MEYFILKDTGEFIRYDGRTIEVYRDKAWREEPELWAVFSGDEPIRNVTREEYVQIKGLG